MSAREQKEYDNKDELLIVCYGQVDYEFDVAKS